VSSAPGDLEVVVVERRTVSDLSGQRRGGRGSQDGLRTPAVLEQAGRGRPGAPLDLSPGSGVKSTTLTSARTEAKRVREDRGVQIVAQACITPVGRRGIVDGRRGVGLLNR
jgi:hypothetical protein